MSSDGEDTIDFGEPGEVSIDTSEGVDMPPGLYEDDDAAEVGEITYEPEVDPGDIPAAEPVVKTIAASRLQYTPAWKVRLGVLPSATDEDHEHSDDCVTECHCVEDTESPWSNPLCECWECECEVHSETGLPFSGSVSKTNDVLDAVNDDDTETTSVYGRAPVVRWPDEDSFDTTVTVRLADKSGVADVQLDSQMDLPDFEAGDELLITDLDVTGEEPAFEAQPNTDVIVVRRLNGSDSDVDGEFDGSEGGLASFGDDFPAGYFLEERSQLVRSEKWFSSGEYTTQEACEWAAEVIVRENHIETPRGGDDIWMYVDDEDSEDHGLNVANSDERIKEIIDEHLPRGTRASRNKNEIVAQVRDKTRVPEDAFGAGAPDHEARRWSVAVKNGVIDLRTGELHDHDPAWRCKRKLPVEYKPGEYDGLGDDWDWFVNDITKTDADAETLLYAIAHALPRCYPVEAVFALIGPGGNGKTIWSKATKALVEPVAGSFKMSAMCGESEFGTGALKGNHIVIDDDATSIKVNDITPLKTHSGGASAEINIKKEKREDYSNMATMVMLSNDPPVFGDKSDGAKRRMYPVILPHKYTDDPTDDNKTKQPEEELLARLTADEELEALLVAAVQRAAEMYDTSEMNVGRTRDERWELYRQYSDSILQFWTDCMTQSRGTRVPRGVVYAVYTQWCDANGIDPVSLKGNNGFWSLSDQCPVISYNRDSVWTDGERAVEHVNLTAEALDYAPDWVRDQWGADVEDSEEDALTNRLDRVTPIEDLTQAGPVTTKGRVTAREEFETNRGTGVKLWIEDRTHAMKVIEYCDDDMGATLDGIRVGDEIQLMRAILQQDKRSVPQLMVDNLTEVTVTDNGPLTDNRPVESDGNDAVNEGDGEGSDGVPVPEDAIDEEVQEKLTRVTGSDYSVTRVEVTGPGEVALYGEKEGFSKEVGPWQIEAVDRSWEPVRVAPPAIVTFAAEVLDRMVSVSAHADEQAEGVARSQESRVTTLKDIISDLEGEKGAEWDDVMEAATEAGISESKIEREREKLTTKGDIYQPTEGHWRAT